jgi:hypothetical protein
MQNAQGRFDDHKQRDHQDEGMTLTQDQGRRKWAIKTHPALLFTAYCVLK